MRNKSTLIFLLILLIYALYAYRYISRTSIVVEGERYFILFDDAMISMRYARNLADGHGLVWNPGGERVEGYTNPLWVLYMSIFHLFAIPASKMSLAIQVSGAFFTVLNLVFVKKIAEYISGSTIVSLSAVALTAFCISLNTWSLQGMEVSVLALITGAVAWFSIKKLGSGSFSPWLYIMLGVGTLVRMDMAVAYLVVLIFLVIFDRQQRRNHLIWGIAIFLAFIIAQSVFRYLYYGDVLPNTYYLKMSGFPVTTRIASGLYVLFQYIWNTGWVLFFLPLCVLIFRRDPPVLLLLMIFSGQLAYSVYVGGDAWEHAGISNRYISIALPLFYILFACSVGLIGRSFASRIPPGMRWAHIAADLGLVLFLLVSMANFSVTDADPRSFERWLLMRRPLFIAGNEEDIQIALDITKITKPEASVAVVTAGAIPYFSNRIAIDLLGKNDPYIARLPAQRTSEFSNLLDFRPGHMKWDYDYSIGELEPDVVVQFWKGSDQAVPYIDQYYTDGGAGGKLTYSLRAGSQNILWDKVQR